MEKVSLDQTLTVLSHFPITFMAPTSLITGWYEEYCRDRAQIRFERFEWKGYEAYSMLMASNLFYKRFLNYNYILICHLDAFVFRDELEYWCGLNYDYIGSIMYNANWGTNSLFRRAIGFTIPEYFGNGGFALKKVSSFYRITLKHRLYITLFHFFRKLQKKSFYDDLFVTQHFPKLSTDFRIPSKQVAQRFGAEYKKPAEGCPEEAPFVNPDKDSLPFGIHGWIQYHQDFWAPYVRRYGYDI